MLAVFSLGSFDFASMLSGALAILTGISAIANAVLGSRNSKLAYINNITTAVAAVEKAVDNFAYTPDGNIDKSKEDLAILLLSKICPKFDDAVARADIEKTLAVIHVHAQSLNTSASSATPSGVAVVLPPGTNPDPLGVPAPTATPK